MSALCKMKDLQGPLVATGQSLVFKVPMVGGGWAPLTKAMFLPWLRGRLSQMGLDAARFHCHAFRHGSIALALEKQPNVTMIRLQSNHISDSIFTYSQIPAEKRGAVSSLMMDALLDTVAGRRR